MKLSRVELFETSFDPKTGKDAGYGGRNTFVVEDGYELELDYNNRVSIIHPNKGPMLVPFGACRFVLPAPGEFESSRPVKTPILAQVPRQEFGSKPEISDTTILPTTDDGETFIDSIMAVIDDEFPEVIDPEPEPTQPKSGKKKRR